MFDQVSHFAGDYTGLATAGTGKHQHGALRVADGFTLSGVELVHNICANPGNSETTWEADILHQADLLYLDDLSAILDGMEMFDHEERDAS